MKCAVVTIRSFTTWCVRRSIQSRKNVGPPGCTSVTSIVLPLCPATYAASAVGAQYGSGWCTANVTERVHVPLALWSHRVSPMMRASSPPRTSIASRSGACVV